VPQTVAAAGWTAPPWLARTLLLAFSGLVLLTLASLTAASLWQRRMDAVAEASRTTQNLTRTLEEHAVRSVREVDFELLTLIRSLAATPLHSLTPAAAHELLARDLRSEAQYTDLVLIDSDGRLVADAAGGAVEVDYSGEDFFIVQRINPAAGLFISNPVTAPDGTHFIAFSRRLGEGTGAFRGIVAAFIDLARFQNFYATLDVGRGGNVTLWNGMASRVFARVPYDPDLLVKIFTRGPLYELIQAGQEEGTFRSVSPLDGVDRIVSYRSVGSLPLVVSVALDAHEVLAGWNRDAWNYGLGLGGACAVLLLLTGALYRQLSRHQALVAALSASEAVAARLNRRFEDAIDSLSASFSIFDAEDRFVIGNRAHRGLGCVAVGTAFADVVAHAAAHLVHPEELGDDPAEWIRRRLARHANPDGPIEIRYRDGRWMRVDESRTREGGTVVVRTDITELKEAEEALRAGEERFRDYAETASDWYWETDAEHRFSYVSERLVSFEIEAADLIGKRRVDVALDRFEDEAKWQAHLACLERHESFTDFVYKAAIVDGEPRYSCTSGKPIFDAAGRFRGYRGTGRDVTAQIKAEESLREAKAAAEAANRAKSEFLAAMSHELRTPLNAIIGFSQLIADERYARDPDQVRDYARDIHASGQHLLKVINDILEISRIEAGKLELHEEMVDLAAAVQSCVALVRQRAAEGEISLRCLVPPDLPRLRADDTRVKQILLNLLSNAVKFTPRGGSITLAAALTLDGELTVSISDTGIGMSEDDISVALQPFRQVDNSIARRFEGTGLGLPLTKAFAELHGGRLDLVSAPGKGTTVSVTFPAVRIVRASNPASLAIVS